MTPGSFEKKNAARWLETDMLMLASEKKNQLVDLRGLPRRFREMCADLSLAQHRMYGQRVIHDLNERVIRGYKILYRGRRAGLEAVVRFSAVTFPQSIRSEWRLFWVCSGFFWLVSWRFKKMVQSHSRCLLPQISFPPTASLPHHHQGRLKLKGHSRHTG